MALFSVRDECQRHKQDKIIPCYGRHCELPLSSCWVVRLSPVQSLSIHTFSQTSSMRRFPSTKPPRNAISDAVISSLTRSRSVLSNDKPPVLRDTSPRLRGVEFSIVKAASGKEGQVEEGQVEEGRSEHGQENNDEADKPEQEKVTDEYNNIRMKNGAHGYAQIEDSGDDGAAEGSENYGQVLERGETTKRQVATNGYEGASRNLDDGELDDEEEKEVKRDGEAPGGKRKRVLEKSGVLQCSTSEERPDKRSKHDGGENLNGAATLSSDVLTTSRTTRKHASRVVTMGADYVSG